MHPQQHLSNTVAGEAPATQIISFDYYVDGLVAIDEITDTWVQLVFALSASGMEFSIDSGMLNADTTN